jgi:hypothetical protein
MSRSLPTPFQTDAAHTKQMFMPQNAQKEQKSQERAGKHSEFPSSIHSTVILIFFLWFLCFLWLNLSSDLWFTT